MKANYVIWGVDKSYVLATIKSHLLIQAHGVVSLSHFSIWCYYQMTKKKTNKIIKKGTN